MDERQKHAVDSKLCELVAKLEPHVDAFIDHMVSTGNLIGHEVELARSTELSSREKIIVVLMTLKQKPRGFDNLIVFMTSKQIQVYSELQVLCGVGTNLLDQFCEELALYYLSHCTQVNTFFGNPVEVTKIHISIEKESAIGEKQGHNKPISDEDMIGQLRDATYQNVAVIAGDPGMGKSTLVKKIGCDWAKWITGGKKDKYPFQLVLKVQLRAAGEADNFLSLALSYLLKLLNCPQFELTTLLTAVSQLRTDVLICFDGLDEYQHFKMSPFENLFAEPFDTQNSADARRRPAPHIPYKMMIVSRPYACRKVNMDFHPLMFKIKPLEESRVDNFAQVFCKGKETLVEDYIKDKKEIAVIPLILLYVCHLANTTGKLPSKLTELYCSLAMEMLLREARESKLECKIDDPSKWMYTEVVRRTARLAYWGICKQRYTFTTADLIRHQVPNDSFVCGFLLHKFNLTTGALDADFPHKSIMDFFAAIHCYLEMSNAHESTLESLDEVIVGICEPGSDFGRFLFGLSSYNKTWSQLDSWIGPAIENCTLTLYTSIERMLKPISNCLADCSDTESKAVALHWRKLFKKLPSVITGSRSIICWSKCVPKFPVGLRKEFEDGVSVVVDTAPTADGSYEWHMQSDELGVAMLRVIAGIPTETRQGGDTLGTNVLVWLVTGAAFNRTVSLLLRLPTARKIVVRAAEKCDTELNFKIDYQTSPKVDGYLTHLSFGFAKEQWDSLTTQCRETKHSQNYVTVADVQKSGEKCDIRWLQLKVTSSRSQGQFISDLLNAALSRGKEHADANIWLAKDQRQCSIM